MARGVVDGGGGRGRGGGQGTFWSSSHIQHYHMVLRPKGTSHNEANWRPKARHRPQTRILQDDAPSFQMRSALVLGAQGPFLLRVFENLVSLSNS